MTKTDMITVLASKVGTTKKTAAAFIDAFEETVTTALVAGEKVQITGFGTFDVKERAAREGRNPQTGETMTISARKAPRFKPGKSLKDAIVEEV